MKDIASATVPGTVEKVIKSPVPRIPDQAQIAVEGTDESHKTISIDNTLIDKNGEEVSLEPGARVEVTIKAKTESIHFGRHSS